MFGKLEKDGLMGFTKFDAQSGDLAFDVHGFHPATAQFLLRYVIGWRLRELLGRMDEANDFVIIVGRGKHSGKGGVLRQCILDELASLEPPIVCKKNSKDDGTLLIDKAQFE